MLQPLVNIPNLPEIQSRNATFGDTIVNIEMNGVNDTEAFSKQLDQAFRTSKVQKQIRSISTDQLSGGSRLGINTIK